MIKTLSAIAAAALIAGILTGFPGLGPDVAASSPLGQNPSLQSPVQPDCAQRGWPYQCVSGKTTVTRNIRLIAIDRIK